MMRPHESARQIEDVVILKTSSGHRQKSNVAWDNFAPDADVAISSLEQVLHSTHTSAVQLRILTGNP